MSQPLLLTGNQAVARAAYEAGVRVATSYPGSPMTQLMENLSVYEGMYCEWSTSEKVAAEVAMGASFAGARTLVSMKHVGINIASDPLMTFAYTPTRGGFVLVVGDDPGMHSSQNEQNSRMWAQYGFMPILEPADAHQAYRMTLEAYALSERVQTPVLLKLTDKTCHMAGMVAVGERVEVPIRPFQPDPKLYCMIPPNSGFRRHELDGRMRLLEQWSEESDLHEEWPGDPSSTFAVITSGHLSLYVQELAPQIPQFRLGCVHPLPLQRLRAFASRFHDILVLEELDPFIETQLRAAGFPHIRGKEVFPAQGELTPERIHSAMVQAGLPLEPLPPAALTPPAVRRPPMLCAGCPHRPVLHILKKLKVECHGDIGCYSLGSQEPFSLYRTSTSMAASLGTAMGWERAVATQDNRLPQVAVIGDSTMVHSGLPSLVNAVYNGHVLKVVLLDNRSTSMTGCQENPSTGINIHGEQKKGFDFVGFCQLLGLPVLEVDQFDYAKARATMKEALEAPGKSVVIITKRPCTLKYKIKEPYFYVDPDVCIGCRTCISVSCPPISMETYPGKPAGKLNSYIRPDLCAGCSVCSQVCPVHAIKRSTPGQATGVSAPASRDLKA